MTPSATRAPSDRREFLRRTLRYAGLAGAAAMAATAVARRAPWTGPSCGGDGICGGCSLRPDCREPRAALTPADASRTGVSP